MERRGHRSDAVELDFSSSGQGQRAATAVSAAGIRLFNAIELVDVEPSATQVEVCECCGSPHCSPGGWVAFRRIGERVVWVPAWDEMEKGEWEMSEYSPPSFLTSQGAPVFSARHGIAFVLFIADSGRPRCATDQLTRDRPPVPVVSTWSCAGNVSCCPPHSSRPANCRDQWRSEAEAECVDQCLRDHYEEKQAIETRAAAYFSGANRVLARSPWNSKLEGFWSYQHPGVLADRWRLALSRL